MHGYRRDRRLTVLLLFSLLFGLLVAPPFAIADEPNPHVFVDPVEGNIWGHEWAPNAVMTVTVVDEGAEVFSATTDVDDNGDFGVHAGRELLDTGQLVEVFDGTTTRSHTITSVRITGVDVVADIVSGTAEPDSAVLVVVGGFDGRGTTADGSGHWSVDFGVAGGEPGQDPIDIEAGSYGFAEQADGDGGATRVHWRAANPHFRVDPVEGRVWGHEWNAGVAMSVTVDGASVNVPDLSDGHGDFNLDLGADVLDTGQVVEVTDGSTTKSHTITAVRIAGVDAVNDTVAGTADAGAVVDVEVHDVDGVWRSVVTDEHGVWVADFGTPGPNDGEGSTFDLGPGSRGSAEERDDDGDATRVHWRITNPHVEVAAAPENWVSGWDWLPNAEVTVSIDGDGGYTTTAQTDEGGHFHLGLDHYVFLFASGHAVTVTDGKTVRTHTVTGLTVTQVIPADAHVEANTVKGWTDSPAGSTVEVRIHLPDGSRVRYVEVQADGSWAADFDIRVGDGEEDRYDLVPGTEGAAYERDSEGNATHAGWRVSTPYIGVNVTYNELWANDWPVDAVLHFTVEDPTTPESPDYQDTMTVVDTMWGHTEAGYRFFEDFDVRAGQVFTVTDGERTKTLEVSTLVVTRVDADTDRYEGTVDPAHLYDSATEVCAWARHPSEPEHRVEACSLPDVAGNWLIDFTGIGDVVAGDHSIAWQVDADGNHTDYAWHVPPWIYVEQGDPEDDEVPDLVHLEQWVFPVTVTNGTDTVVVEPGPEDDHHWVTIEFALQPGDTITATGDDGRQQKSLYLWDLALTGVTYPSDEEPPADPYIVSGTTSTGYQGQVQVAAFSNVSGWWAERWVRADDGKFAADFGKAGHGWREREVFRPDSHTDPAHGVVRIHAAIWDGENDQVWAPWDVERHPRIYIVRGNDRIEAIDFPAGAKLTVEIDDPATGNVDWSGTGIVGRDPDNPRQTLLVFELGDYRIPDSATVTATDDAGTPQVVTTVIALTIDDIDQQADTITGTAAPGTEVLVQADYSWRYPIANETGDWVADFSQPGSQPGEERRVDIGPGSSGRATVLSEGGNATTVLWSIPTDHVPPQILSFDGPEEPLAYTTPVTIQASFQDPDQTTGHAVTLEWGDGTTTYPTPAYDDGVGTISGTHQYSDPGVYTITLTIADNTGLTATEVFEYAVMYDPAGTRIQGTVQAATETSSIHLSINVSRHPRSGALQGPVRANWDDTGFATGFEATDISQLLIFGDWGIVTGTGTIDGTGTYDFLVSVLDRSEQDGAIDAFRLRVWDDDEILFDTQHGDPDLAVPTTIPDSGDLKIR
jgi:hypothetical protein